MSCNTPNRAEKSCWQPSFEYLIDIEAAFAVVLDAYGPPPIWKRKESFASLVKIILEQQVSLASAQAAFDKLEAVLSSITPGKFLALDDIQLKAVGFSRQKTSYVRNLAHALVKGTLNLNELKSLPDESVRSSLTSIKGIGTWTANIYLLMVLQRPDIWPRGDIALAASYQRLKQLPQRPTSAEMVELSSDWAPCRSIAARLLWHYYLSGK